MSFRDDEGAPLTHDENGPFGFTRLSETLETALDTFAASDTVQSWFPAQFAEIYLAHKQGEIAHLADMDTDAKYGAYADTY